ncbi:hypothetical protein SASPL_142536 [Salvia splendens]|uniref:Protein kinase domain-containing protein n=1 Tax=Salvia splendens TaxID=180675 RepID=A0A8X8Z9H5_SALSN|nr:hypothetical protein SASPL_142536 [Salvia splendens]
MPWPQRKRDPGHCQRMRARVADFGLAKRLTTRIAGTHGYLAPEYALYGQLTEKSDMYSFGIVVREEGAGSGGVDSRT